MNAIRLFSAFGIAALAGGITSAAQADRPSVEAFLQFAEIQAVSGRESAFTDFLRRQLPADARTETDNMGNLVVQYGGPATDLLVVTSIDEPGYVITEITEDGYLRVASPAGPAPSPLFHQFHEGHYVDIATAGGIVRGVVALPSSHIFRGRRENLALERFLIDIGARSREEAVSRGIEMLDPLTAVKDTAALAENRVAGPMLSRKIGAFAIASALKNCKPGPGKGVVVAWAAQGLMRNSGVQRLARKYSPRQVVIVGAFARNEDRRTGTVKDPIDTPGSGVLVPDAESAGGRGALLEAASAAAAGRAIRLTATTAGSLPELRPFDSGKVDVLPVAIAVKYPGTLVEVIDLDDLDQLIAFLRLVVEM